MFRLNKLVAWKASYKKNCNFTLVWRKTNANGKHIFFVPSVTNERCRMFIIYVKKIIYDILRDVQRFKQFKMQLRNKALL